MKTIDPYSPPPITDTVLPFQLDNLNLRGRFAKLDMSISSIINQHGYPPAVARLLAESLALTVTLAAFLKYDGIFTLQTSGDGVIRMLVCDMTSQGHLRGYAQFDATALDTLLAGLPDDATPGIEHMLGNGHLAFTVDQGQHSERYQGIIPLEGADLAACITQYFTSSEQIRCAVKTAVGQSPISHSWQASALIVQKMPDVAPISSIILPGTEDAADSWRRVQLLLATCSDEELLGTAVGSELMLYRLFHQEDIRVYEPTHITARCRCSREKILSVIAGASDDDWQAMAENGAVKATCEFCGTEYTFTESDRKYQGRLQ